MDADIAVAALAALGHKYRLDVWRILLPHGPLGLSAGVIASNLSIAPSSLSFHLQQMVQGRVLVQRRSSRQIIYAVNGGLMDSLCDFLSGDDVIQISVPALSARESGDIVGER